MFSGLQENVWHEGIHFNKFILFNLTLGMHLPRPKLQTIHNDCHRGPWASLVTQVTTCN